VHHARHLADLSTQEHGYRIAGELLANGLQLAIEHRPATIDEQDALAHLFHLVHLMGAHDHSRATIAHGIDQLADDGRVDGVQAREGLINDHQLRLVHGSRHELHLLPHPAAEGLHLEPAGFPQVDLLQVALRALPGGGQAQTLELAQVEQQIPYLHVTIETALLRQVANTALGILPEGPSEHDDRATVGLDQVQDHADRRRLAGTVGAQEPKDLTVLDRKRDVLYGLDGTKALDEMLRFHRAVGHGMPPYAGPERCPGQHPLP